MVIRDQANRPIRDWPLLISLDTTYPYHRAAPVAAEARQIPEAIYGGIFVSIFGHFLTETAVNLAAIADTARAHPELPLLFHMFPDLSAEGRPPLPEITGPVRWALDRTGIDPARLVFVDTPVKVGQLLVPESPFTGKFGYSRHAAACLDRHFAIDGTGPEKVYYSRSRIARPRLADEARIEALVADHGYEILHPQEHSLDDQLRIIRNARSLVGPQGTALHWSLYSDSLRNVLSLGWGSPLQKGISKLRGQAYRELRGRRPKDGPVRQRQVPLDQIDAALDAL